MTEAGAKFKIDYLWESVVEPRANLATSFMPDFKLKPEDVKCLVIFLKSRRGMNFNETGLAQYRAQMTPIKLTLAPELRGHGEISNPVEQGREVLESRSCTACHKLGDKDGGIAPDLTFEGLVRKSDWVLAHFKNPRETTPDSIMPSFRFPEQDFTAMTAYLGSLQKKPPELEAAAMFKTYCARCHGEKGDGKGRIAYYLDPAPRDLTRTAFLHSKPRERFLESIRHGVPGTSMPPWGNIFGDKPIEAVYDYVDATFTHEPRKPLKTRDLPEQNPAPSTQESIARGETIFLARCTGCHGRKADGKGPNSLDIIPHPRNLRNNWFVNALADRRAMESILYGVQGTAMPSWIDYGLTKKDAGDLLNFIRSLNIAPAKAQLTAGVR